ncbi:hypothetical protein GCM10027176_61460 [Actinoallomurus bryophytorum]
MVRVRRLSTGGRSAAYGRTISLLLPGESARFGTDVLAGTDEVVAIGESVRRLVGLDVASGGDRTSVLATRALQTPRPC